MNIRACCMAHFYDRTMAKAEAATVGAWRNELLQDVHGTVLELGSGTGLNLPHYSEAVDRLVLSEPDAYMRRELAKKLPGFASLDCEVSDADAEQLPFPDAQFDFVVETLVLCSVQSQQQSLAEIRRVLKPGGAFVFLEHVASEDARIAKWQRFWQPLWKTCGGNCHLTRHTGTAIEQAGFRFERLDEGRMMPAPAVVQRTIRGRAR